MADGYVGLTGFLAQLTRMADMAGVAYPMYFLHLVFVFYIIAYLPFSTEGEPTLVIVGDEDADGAPGAADPRRPAAQHQPAGLHRLHRRLCRSRRPRNRHCL